MDISDIHKNAKLLIDGTPYNVDEAEFMKPGKGRAIYRLKLRIYSIIASLTVPSIPGKKLTRLP
jgi:hypothetical protein